ncbi:MAG: alpha/beta fold hydrolase [Anaerolineales bacterium]|nr:alpha/beta fold hydrolase [Anaerolineales bacterium]
MDLHVDTSGSAERPTILFLHGSPLSGRMWKPQLAGLAPDFQCLAPDLPEHGRSAGIGPFQIRDAVRRLSDLVVRSAPSGRAHVVGLSFGGVVAQALMVLAPERVDRVILSGTATRLNPTLFAILKLQVDLNRPLLRWLPPKVLATMMRWQFDLPRAYDADLAEDLAAVPGDTLARFLLATYADILTPTATQSPTLVVVGNRETPFARWQARRLAETIPGARAARAPGLGHVWNLQNPNLFNAMVRAWMLDRPLPQELETR